jgi:hypothetical protein
VFLLAASTLLPAQRKFDEREIKATFIFNFAQFVEWPTASFANPQAPLLICVFSVTVSVRSSIQFPTTSLMCTYRVEGVSGVDAKDDEYALTVAVVVLGDGLVLVLACSVPYL